MCLAAPAKVISISDKEAVVDYNGVRTTTRLDTLTEPLAPGDYVLIHTGFAIRRLSAEDGEETLKLFDELANSLDLHDMSSDENANSLNVNDANSDENALRSRVDDETELDAREQPKSSPVGDVDNWTAQDKSDA